MRLSRLLCLNRELTTADVIISNGKILTVDPEFSIAHSLAIDDGRIVAVGSTQAVARKAALIAHTINDAKLLFKEDSLGSLETGKLADLVVLDRDYMTVPPEQIAAIRPVLTMTGGRITFEEN